MITTVLVGSLLSLAPGAGAVGEGHMGLFYARISPDGSQAAFNMGGDIWVADLETGECARVTDHVAHDHHPVWFPDGARIAFSSNRDGNDDVYSIPAIGGTPTRHTWHGTADIAMDVSPDGERILFRSWRRMYAVDLYEVDTKGGLPRPITNDSGLNLESRYSFDGNSIAVCRGAASWVRREYHGSGDSDLYVMDRDGKNMRWVENRYDGIDFWPTFGPNGEYIFFVSDRELGCENVYRIPSGGGPAERLTSFRTRPVQFLSVARTGRMCFVQDFRLWTMDGPEATPRAVNLRCGTEPKHSQEARLDVAGQVSEIEVGPLGLHLAVIARGELYSLA
jgi:dipeptidyl aminopeptidase/acylaminoacyl peptidase